MHYFMYYIYVQNNKRTASLGAFLYSQFFFVCWDFPKTRFPISPPNFSTVCACPISNTGVDDFGRPSVNLEFHKLIVWAILCLFRCSRMVF
jgi:hypothetical protein